jgi:hypothetical protein
LLPTERPRVVSVSPGNGASGVNCVTEIRVRFDRPMDPASVGLFWTPPIAFPTADGVGGFRLRDNSQYLPETKEFVIPVVLKAGATHRLGLQKWGPGRVEAEAFRSTDGVAAAVHSWRFSTRDSVANTRGPRPRVVSVDPPSGAETAVFTPIRIRFDRPMDPKCYDLVDTTWSDPTNPMTSVPFPVEYDPKTNTFTLRAFLPFETKTRIELRGFCGADGGEAEPAVIEYRVGDKLYSPEQEARIAETGRSAKLHEVVEAVRRNRLALDSVEEAVLTVDLSANQPVWFSKVRTNLSRFCLQGDRQVYADVSSIMSMPFRVGSDGQQCWYLKGEELVACPFEAIHVKNTLFCDPFGSSRFQTAEQAIEELKLEYLGAVEHQGKTCHRVRSWLDRGSDLFPLRGGVQDWLIDANTLLPVLQEEYWRGFCTRNEFTYHRVNEPSAIKVFRPPADPGLTRRELEPLEEGYDHRFLNARDGSDGRMSVRWGEYGPKGGRSSGLN